MVGDLNVAHSDRDVMDPKKKRNKVPGFNDGERENFGALVGGDGTQPYPLPDKVKAKRTELLGRPGPSGGETPFVDVQHLVATDPPETFEAEEQPGTHFTFWSYMFGALGKGNGWRLDYFLVTPSLVPRIRKFWKRHDLYYNSDHVPIGLELDFPKYLK